MRQLAAHEVGHTLGLAHNYIASVANRASVMDYPHPLVKLNDDGSVDLSDAYATGIGEWDKVAIAYGYQDFPRATDEKAALTKTLTDAMSRGLIFLTDQDARPPGSAHPQTHLWDNGTNAVDELKRFMQLRAAALKRFSENNIRPGAPMATLEEALVPLYLGHRYQVEAAIKVIGGMSYTFALRGDGQTVTSVVPPEEQRRALAAILNTIKPDALMLPEKIVKLIPPRAFGYDRHRELFRPRTGLTFDPLAPVEAAATHTVGLLLNSERAARLVEYRSMNMNTPGLVEVVEELLRTTWMARRSTGFEAEVQRVVDDVTLYHLMSLAANDNALTQVRAVAALKLDELKSWMTQELKLTREPSQRAHLAFGLSQIALFQQDPKKIVITRPAEPPPGQPIGMKDAWGWCDWE
ncbi:MAG: zinc-dependent metalloprotease [Candidatus Binataceae bacterium]